MVDKEKEALVNLGCIRFGYSPRLVSLIMLEIACKSSVLVVIPHTFVKGALENALHVTFDSDFVLFANSLRGR